MRFLPSAPAASLSVAVIAARCQTLSSLRAFSGPVTDRAALTPGRRASRRGAGAPPVKALPWPEGAVSAAIAGPATPGRVASDPAPDLPDHGNVPLLQALLRTDAATAPRPDPAPASPCTTGPPARMEGIAPGAIGG